MSDPAPRSGQQVPAPPDLEQLHKGHDLTHLDAGPGMAGRIRALLHRLLLPLFKRQTDQNAAAARLASQFWVDIGDGAGRTGTLEAQAKELGELPAAFRLLRSDTEFHLDELRRQVAGLRGEVTALRQQNVASLDAMLDAVRAEVARLEEVLSRARGPTQRVPEPPGAADEPPAR